MRKKAAKAGFELDDKESAFKKLECRLAELKTAAQAENAQAVEAEVGELLASAVNLARLLKVDPNSALENANTKFYSRFSSVEAQVKANNKTLKDCSTDELETYWKNAQ